MKPKLQSLSKRLSGLSNLKIRAPFIYPAQKRVYPRPSRLSNALAAVSMVAALGVMGNLFYRLPSQAEGGIVSLTSFVSKNLVAMLLCALPCVAGIIADCRAKKRQAPASPGI